MFHYAQINADGRCFAALSTPRAIDDPNMIQVVDDPASYIGRTYADGIWSD